MLLSFYFRFHVAAVMLLSAAVVQATDAVDYNRDVRPILSSQCFGCHGPDAQSRQAELRLDRFEDASADRGGYFALVPHQPQQSEVFLRITSDNPDLRMPPQDNKPLSAEEIEILERWILVGAVYKPHWAFVPPQRPTIPKVSNRAWARGPIDSFVVARIEAAALQPSPQAASHTLVRRLYLDLIGLPPLPDEVEAFDQEVAETSLDAAYERLVDRLLDSPRYGERWARPWLDLARYADTNGYEKDRDRSMWPYRDWVIQALNADMPFDQFTIEQLAGDMLPGVTIEQQIASGFHRNTMLNEEGGIDPLEFRFHAMTDRMATTGTTWLGLTLGCAQCHSHKYDPITHSDYYQFMAFLNNADEPEIDLPDAKLDAQYHENLERADELLAELHAKWPLEYDDGEGSSEEDLQLKALRKRFDAWLDSMRKKTARWTPFHPVQAVSNLPLLTIQEDDSILASGDTTKRDHYEITFRPHMTGITAIRLEALPDNRLPGRGPGTTYYEGSRGDFFLGELRLEADGKPVPIKRATHSYAKNRYGEGDQRPVAASLTIDGDPQTGWSVYQGEGQRHVAIYQLPSPLETVDELQLNLDFGRHYASSLGRFRLAATTDLGEFEAANVPSDLEELLLISDDRLNTDQRWRLWEVFLLRQGEFEQQNAEIEKLRQRPEYPRAMVMRERPPHNPRKSHRHHRGDFLQPAEEVHPQTPAVLHPFPQDMPRDRLGLAHWLVSPENPLTSRVVVNRHWAALFGRGIVATIDDFGTQGASPTHPQLLDWLAVEFVRQGWSLKWLHRTIVTSATYRQSSRFSDETLAKDPDNLFLTRAPRPRLEAEVIRDSILRSSGLLSLEMGGPGVRPPQPAGVTEVAWGSPKWIPSEGSDRYRRSIYTFRKRTAPFAMYESFDAPSGESCTAKRDISNTPLQALTLLNDEMFLEAAQALGLMLCELTMDDEARLRYVFRRVLSRPPSGDELNWLMEFVSRQKSRFTHDDLDAAVIAGGTGSTANERAVWTTLARALFSLDESLTRN